MQTIISVSNLSKTYDTGFRALKGIDLSIRSGEIFALLGPNGAGKTTLIGSICGMVRPTGGSITVSGYDIRKNYRAARSLIGLVPQELIVDAFETVWGTVSFTRGLYGKPMNHAYIETLLKDLVLWDKRHSKIMELSGGMKRRVLLAKALSHEPRILFLDEPTAGIDIKLRLDMWKLIGDLRAKGMTIILTTHYIEEAEKMADRIGVMDSGEIVLVETKTQLMRKLGKAQLIVQMEHVLDAVPPQLAAYQLELSASGDELVYTYPMREEHDLRQNESSRWAGSASDMVTLLHALRDAGICCKELHVTQSSLEEILLGLIRNRGRPGACHDLARSSSMRK